MFEDSERVGKTEVDNNKLETREMHTFDNGDMYLGQWNPDTGKPEGYGVVTHKKTGAIYEGDFLAGRKHGKGKLYFGNGELSGGYFEGTYDQGYAEGKGKLVYPDGKVYEGDVHKDMKHGKGVDTWPNGNRYEGNYEHDK